MRAIAIILLAAVMLAIPRAAAASSDAVAVYATAAAASLPKQARDTLRAIDGGPRQLLATRAYLRADESLATRWSWSAQEIDEYQRSSAYRSLLDAVAKVNARFEAQNPGYSLFVNTQVRSLDLQLRRWNENRGVAKAAQRIYVVAGDELKTGRYPAAPDEKATQRFVAFLKNLPAAIPVPLAAPGLSLHGQSRAMDFQVRRGNQTVAGAEIASVAAVWEKQGWARKLERAVDPAQGSFVGPLQTPNEPWHYEYVR